MNAKGASELILNNTSISDANNAFGKIVADFLEQMKNGDASIDAKAGEEEVNAFRVALHIVREWKNGKNVSLGFHRPEGIPLLDSKSIVWVENAAGLRTYYTLDRFRLDHTEAAAALDSLASATSDDEAPPLDFSKVGVAMGFKSFGYHNRTPYHLEGGTLVALQGDRVSNEILSGSFWRWTHKCPVDLHEYQIYPSVKKENYVHNCFVHACINSGVFTSAEIDSMCRMIKTRSFPRKNVKLIAKEFKVNFIVRHVDKNNDKKTRCDCDTRKLLKETYDRTVEMYIWHDHYLLHKKKNITDYYLDHYEEINEEFPEMSLEQRMSISDLTDTKIKFAKSERNILAILRSMFARNLFEPISPQDMDLLNSCEYNEHLDDYEDLEYDKEQCCRPYEDRKVAQEYDHILYADFEADPTVSPHRAYLCCVVWTDKLSGHIYQKTFTGNDCARQFLEWLPTEVLVYFHNLKYDASFFMNISKKYHQNIIEHSGSVKQITFTSKQNGGRIVFRDSYSIIPKPLREFGSMFGLKQEKEVMIYNIYTEENLKKGKLDLEYCIESLRFELLESGIEDTKEKEEQFIANCKKCGCLQGDYVDIMQYAVFYCLRDCIVLMQGLQKFDNDLKEVFASNGKNWIGLQSYISISSIGYDFAGKYGCMDGCIELAGKPQNFIARSVSGGRTMVAGNQILDVSGQIQDFDAVSLYPSAMYVMPGIPKGCPKVISPDACKNKSFKSADAYYVEININRLECKSKNPYKFPLVFKVEGSSKLFVNEPVKNFYLDKRSLEDLEEFYDIDYDVIRGYYFDEGVNSDINKFIKTCFDLRARYKRECNPLQETIKLLLNSIYGKSILKPIETETSVVDSDKVENYIIRNYNFLKSLDVKEGCNHAFAKKIRPVNKHFNMPQFGVSVLSWSKHLMNRVICLAEQNDIPIYYQDTDSMHLDEKNVPKLAELFRERYGSELIGTNLTQFHCDFAPVNGKSAHSTRLIALGKKSYLDILENEDGDTAYHIRMKGIPNQVILNYCRNNGITVEDLYEDLYYGAAVTFDLLDGSKCFRKNKFYEQCNPEEFTRTVSFG